MPDIPMGRQRLKQSALLIERRLSDLQLIFDKDLRDILGPEGTEYIDLEYLQSVDSALADFSIAQLRRAIKYDAKDSLELHPDLDMVRRQRAFLEQEAVDRMLFVDDIDISGHEDDPMQVFEQLLLPYPDLANDLAMSSTTTTTGDDSESKSEPESESETRLDPETRVKTQLSVNRQTVIRPYGYRPTRFFQGFCYVEYATPELSALMSTRICARDNSVRVMPMKQWRKLESEYLSMRVKTT